MACYPDDRSAAQHRLGFTQNPLGKLGDLRVAEQGGRIVGHVFGFSLVSYFGGSPVQALGIASLGVAPEARGGEIGSRLVSHAEDEARERGAALALLYAYRHGFYGKRGYADVAPMKRLSCDPRAVPRSWVLEARERMRAAKGATDAKAIIALHRHAARRLTGCIERPSTLWTRLFARERLHFVLLPSAGSSRSADGYVAFEYLQDEPHARTRIVVQDLVAEDDHARRVLWGFVGMQAGQVAEVEIEVADDDDITFALTDIDGGRFGDEMVEHSLGCIVAGPMVRMLDAPRALAARGYETEGDVDLRLPGSVLRASVRGNHAEVARAAMDCMATAVRSSFELGLQDERTLASVAFGGLGMKDAARLGLVRGSPEAIATADAMFHLPPFVTLDRF